MISGPLSDLVLKMSPVCSNGTTVAQLPWRVLEAVSQKLEQLILLYNTRCAPVQVVHSGCTGANVQYNRVEVRGSKTRSTT